MQTKIKLIKIYCHRLVQLLTNKSCEKQENVVVVATDGRSNKDARRQVKFIIRIFGDSLFFSWISNLVVRRQQNRKLYNKETTKTLKLLIYSRVKCSIYGSKASIFIVFEWMLVAAVACLCPTFLYFRVTILNVIILNSNFF